MDGIVNFLIVHGYTFLFGWVFFEQLGLPIPSAPLFLAAGALAHARAEAAEVLRLNLKFSVHSYAKRMTFKDQSVIDDFINALRKAGLK